MLFMLILNIVFLVICYKVGTDKGYSGGVCCLAGLVGGLLALVVIALLPNKKEQSEREEYYQHQISMLRNRVSVLEAERNAASRPAGEPSEAPQKESVRPSDRVTVSALFPTRTSEMISCPKCRKKQQGNRDACYSCGAEFRYVDETT